MNEHELQVFRAGLEADRIRKLIGPNFGGGSRIKVPREPASIGIGAAKSGREVNPPARPRPPAEHMRSEAPRPARPTTMAERIWPDLRR